MKTYLTFHGLGTSSRSFEPLSELLKQAGHTVKNVDFSGFGPRVQNSYDGNPLEFALKEALDKFENQKNLSLIAHSMGAAVALKLAEKIPNHINEIIIIEGNLIAEDCGYLSRKIADETDDQKLKDLLNDIFKDMEKSPYPGWRLWAEEAQQIETRILREYSASLVKLSQSGELLSIFKALPCKKLYLYGQEYKNHPVLQVLGDIPKHYIEEAGHFVMTDKPQECFERIMDLKNG